MSFADHLHAPADIRRRRAAALLAAALTLHDLEEAIAYPRVRPAVLEFLPFAPPPAAFWAALAVVTALGVGVAFWAGRGPATGAKTGVLRAMAAILLANILIPHAPAAILLGGYAPGVVTALTLNLPVGLLAWVLLRPSP